MTREEARKAAEVMMAYAEGKEIEFNDHTSYSSMWEELPDLAFNWGKRKYRIKPEPKYRPFKTKEECWKEMHKHPDFGWVNYDDSICFIQSISPKGITITDWAETNSFFFDECLENLTFTDGIPFGINE